MTDISKHISDSYDIYEAGQSGELYALDNGMVGVRFRGDRKDPYIHFAPRPAPPGMSIGEIGEKMALEAPGLAAGAISATVGFPGDMVGIARGIYKAIGAEEGQRLDEFITGINDISSKFGSQATMGVLTGLVNSLPIEPEQKSTILEAAKVGEYIGVPVGAGGAAKVVQKFGPDALEAVGEAGLRAEQRLSQRGTRMMSGVDPTQVADEAITLAGKGARAVNPKTQQDELRQLLEIRAREMDLKEKDRIQPSGQNKLFNTSPEAYQADLPPQAETYVPRAPQGAKLPKNNRAAILVDEQQRIAERLAERMRPYLGTPAQYFYNTGPLIKKAVELGIPEEKAREQLKNFALNYAATSPRTRTDQNLRNASLVAAKERRGIPFDEVVGPGGTGINEKGYPMMIGGSGIHRKLLEAKREGGINFDTNPKPATFAENVMGNLQGVTVDTHAVRGALDALNDIAPGSIPEGFFLKKIKTKEGGVEKTVDSGFYEKYKQDPESFDPATMIDDSIGSQKVGGKSMQTEYAIFSDLYKRAADILGVSPAEAQSLGWFGSGDRTGLASELKTVVDLIDDRVDVTAQALGKPKDEVFVKFMNGEIPLLSVGGLAAIDEILADQKNGDM